MATEINTEGNNFIQLIHIDVCVCVLVVMCVVAQG